MGDHSGHRERMKKRFLEQGLNGFEDHQVLELLLFYSVPRRDTNLLAHSLMEYFGSLEAVFNATAEELAKVEGIGEHSVTLFKLVPAVSRRYMIEELYPGHILNSTRDAGNYIVPHFLYERDEVVYIICLDAKNKVICCKELFRGGPNSTIANVRKIVEFALGKNSTGVIIAHNHTSGIAIPSVEDEEHTQRIKAVLANVGIKLIDHIVVAGEDYVSMADSGTI